MRISLIALLLSGLLILFSCSPRELQIPGNPGVLLLDRQALLHGRALAQNEDESVKPALTALIARADATLASPLGSVVDQSMPAPSGDPHDYTSLALYYWPDPQQPEGLPWITRDGKVNPDAVGSGSDKEALRTTAQGAYDLALAWYFTGEERYAEAAAQRIRHWFLSPETRMNPHFTYAQRVPGLREGSRFGIIDGQSLPRAIDAALLLEESDAWSSADTDLLRAWFKELLAWLRTSEFGLAEGASENNHGTFYHVQVATYALFTGDVDLARELMLKVRNVRIPAQITSKGEQPHEMTRTRTFHYHHYNLWGLFELAELAEKVDINLWDAHGKRLCKALELSASYADPKKVWPHPEIKRDPMLLYWLLRRGANKYQRSDFEGLLQDHANDAFLKDRILLTTPALP